MKRKAVRQVNLPKRQRRGYTVYNEEATEAQLQPYRAMTRGVVPPPRYNLGGNLRYGGFENFELKYIDLQKEDGGLTTTWASGVHDPNILGGGAATQCLNGISQGDGATQRDGRAYMIHSVHIKGYILVDDFKNTADPYTGVLARVALVLDKQTNGAQMDASQLYNGSAVEKESLCFRNLEYTQRFRVLEDLTIPLNPVWSVTYNGANVVHSAGGMRIPFTINKKFKTPIKVNCSATGATVASITDNSLHIVAMYDGGVGYADHVFINYVSRVRFVG